MRFASRSYPFAVIALLAGVSAVWAGAVPSAQSLVRSMVAKYQGLSSFEEVAVQDISSRASMGMQRGFHFNVRFVYKKPNKFFYRLDDNQAGVYAVCDGKSIWLYIATLHEYVRRPAPASLAQATKVIPLTTVADPASIVLGIDPLRGAKNVKVTGGGAVSGQQTWKVSYSSPQGDLQLWIGADDAVLYKMNFKRAHMIGKMQTELDTTEVHTKMKMNAPVADSVFKFEVPRGAKLVDKLSTEKSAVAEVRG